MPDGHREPVPVVAEVASAYGNLHQLYTGLALLAREGLIRLRQVRRPFRERGTCLLHVGDATVLVDTRDEQLLVEEWVGRVDVYAKRSYQPAGYDVPGTTVVPYGLNYAVYPPCIDLHALRRMGAPGNTSHGGTVARALHVDRLFGWPASPRASFLRPHPASVEPDAPQVIFFTRLWKDPTDDRPDVVIERRAINDQRAACIRALRAEFGPRFVGGLEAEPLAQRLCPELVADPSETAKLRYLHRLVDVPVGVATVGLHRSIGWKFGEYVATARAIVSDPLWNDVPGPLAAGTHYLTFTSADECVERCRQLVDDPARIDAMSGANAAYYEEFVRPDRLVRRVLSYVAPSLSIES